MLAVQSMASSRYVFFKAQSLQWHRALSAVAEVTGVLGDIQRLWSYLEPLFVGSEEVKRELPNDAQRFQGVDSQVRDVLKTMWKTKKVRDACNAPGLLAQLEKLHKELEVCRKSLVDFLDGKRRLFPRFYFTSEADLLDILSNGSSPQRIMRHVEKVLLATKALELKQPEAENARPAATKVLWHNQSSNQSHTKTHRWSSVCLTKAPLFLPGWHDDGTVVLSCCLLGLWSACSSLPAWATRT
jgi:dynein heavy chain